MDMRDFGLKPIGPWKMTAAQREAINEGKVQGRLPYPIVWSCRYCCRGDTPNPAGGYTVHDNIGDDDEFVLESDREIGLTFAHHFQCVEISNLEDELRVYRENGGMLQ